MAVPASCASSQAFVCRDAVGLVVDAVQVEFVVGRLHVRRVADVGDRPLRGVERRLDLVAGEPRGGRLLDRGDRQAELAGELEVALVAARHRHDRAGAVAHQHVVGDPHRDLLAVDRVGGVRAGEHAGLLAGLVLALEVLLLAGLLPVGGDGVGLLGDGEVVDERMLGRQHHERRTEQRVGSGREHGDVAGVARGSGPRRRGCGRSSCAAST